MVMRQVSHAHLPRVRSLCGHLPQYGQAFLVLFSLVPAVVAPSFPSCVVWTARFWVPPPFRRHSFAESELTTSPSASHLPKFLLMFLDQGVSYHPPYFAFNRVSGGIMGKNA